MRLEVVLFWSLCLFGAPVLAQESSADFVGTWELSSIEEKTEDGGQVRLNWVRIR